MPDFDAVRLKNLLADACRGAFSYVRKQHDNESFYCMGLLTPGLFGYVVPTAMTEQGLDSVVREYQAKPRYVNEPIDRLRFSLRWSPADSPLHLEGNKYFEEVNTLMPLISKELYEIDTDGGWDEFERFATRIKDAIIEVLAMIEKEGYFGTNQEREQVFVSILRDDQDDSILQIGRRLNPPATVARFEKEWQTWKDFWESKAE
jgi:hypothetical protein